MVLKQVHDTNMRAKGHPERVFSVGGLPPPSPPPPGLFASVSIPAALLAREALDDFRGSSPVLCHLPLAGDPHQDNQAGGRIGRDPVGHRDLVPALDGPLPESFSAGQFREGFWDGWVFVPLVGAVLGNQTSWGRLQFDRGLHKRLSRQQPPKGAAGEAGQVPRAPCCVPDQEASSWSPRFPQVWANFHQCFAPEYRRVTLMMMAVWFTMSFR